ncbi:hypothetical protein [Rubinisphaera italica]|uniref:Lipoprotein n=1 Tax=Rubinisphaera italica TaxID=2527969 RepID=A0A5C5XRX5_9PLAN|nr:hypothetical protein [Rubinisphaera italica]TWT64492.1 hypothetical protein Pan54_52560 [Rubinisphaera italica]
MRDSSLMTVIRKATLLTFLIGAVSLTGCNYAILLGYLIGGPPSIEPDFDVQTNKSMSDKEVSVCVVAFAPTNLKWDFPKIDHELSRYVAFRLVEHEIKVVNPDQVKAWLDSHPDWDKPEEIGKAFDCNYVIYIDMNDFHLYEENSTTLYRGRSENYISVIEMDEDGYGEKIYSKEVNSKYPIRAPRSTSEMSLDTFKREYLSRLSKEIGWLFFERFNGDDIPDAV